jgi:hypothetical protein
MDQHRKTHRRAAAATTSTSHASDSDSVFAEDQGDPMETDDLAPAASARTPASERAARRLRLPVGMQRRMNSGSAMRSPERKLVALRGMTSSDESISTKTRSMNGSESPRSGSERMVTARPRAESNSGLDLLANVATSQLSNINRGSYDSDDSA